MNQIIMVRLILYLPERQLLLALVAGVLYDPAQRTLVAPVAVAPAVLAGAALTIHSPR